MLLFSSEGLEMSMVTEWRHAVSYDVARLVPIDILQNYTLIFDILAFDLRNIDDLRNTDNFKMKGSEERK